MTDFIDRIRDFSPQRLALLALDLNERLEAMEDAAREPLAIVGMACRFPGGADSPEHFWDLLRAGVDAIVEVPSDRWDIDAYFDSDPDAPGKMSTRWGGFLSDVDSFDPEFFGMSPREAADTDPQQRLLLEVTWEALESAGIAADQLRGSKTGVFVGLCSSDFFQLVSAGDQDKIGMYTAAGASHSIASGRLSYVLGLRGPAYSIDTACSSSLVALHVACRSLRARECDMALVAGVNVMLWPLASVALSKSRMMAPDGRCKAFDAAADGFVRGEGCGVVAVKRLSDAIVAGDRMLALIRGTATNQDGRSNGLTAPNGPAQQEVIRDALLDGGITPASVGYVETHGTGTSLGDPIEVQALGAVLAEGRPADDPVAIGSVKTNIGHLEAAAGIAGLIKTVLMLQHGEIPPHLHFRSPNLEIEWNTLPVRVVTELTRWMPRAGRRVAGVSSFGFSGSNAHVILEEAPEPAVESRASATGSSAAERDVQILTVSATSSHSLGDLCDRYASYIAAHSAQSLADICHTANVGRADHRHRLAIIARSAGEVVRDLRDAAKGNYRSGAVFHAELVSSERPRVAFLFSGQGGQHPGMGRRLYQTQPRFRDAIDRCAEILQPLIGTSLGNILWPEDGARDLIDRTEYAQPALFALQYALAEVWRSWGIEPSVVMGHSLGEYAAACIAGVFSLEDGLALVAERGHLTGGMPETGAMAAIFLDEDDTRHEIARYRDLVEVAAVNGPLNTVVSGDGAAIEELMTSLQARGVEVRRLRVSRAFHSSGVEAVLPRFRERLARTGLRRPSVQLLSNLTGTAVDAEIATVEYWCRHLREPVQFSRAIAELDRRGIRHFIEVGPHPTLLGMASACFEDDVTRKWLPSLRRDGDDWGEMLGSLAALYTSGARVNWPAVHSGAARRRIALPTYPFARDRLPAHRMDPKHPTPGDRGATASARRVDGRLLGHGFESAKGEVIYECELGLDTLPLLSEHRVHGMIVVPAPVFVELAMEAADELGTTAPTLLDFELHGALTVAENAPRRVQVIVAPVGDGEVSIEIFAKTVAASRSARFKRHASARLVVGDPSGTVPLPVPMHDAEERCRTSWSGVEFYEILAGRGFDFGPAFRRILSVQRCEGEAIARILCETPRKTPFIVEPAALDTCLQALGAAVVDPAAPDDGVFYLLAGIERMTLFGGLHGALISHARLRTALVDGGSVTADLTVTDGRGAVVATVEGVRLAPVTREVLLHEVHRAKDNWFFGIEWERRDAEVAADSLLGEPSTIAEALAPGIPSTYERFELAEYEELVRELEGLSAEYVVTAAATLGWPYRQGQTVELHEVAERWRVPERFQRLLERMFSIMAEEGLLRRCSSGWEVTGSLACPTPAVTAQTILDRFPSFRTEVALLRRCGERLASVMNGSTDPLELLFPGGDTSDVEGLTGTSRAARACNSLVADAIAAALRQVPAGRPLRILEVGAGTGGTSKAVLPLLAPHTFEYVFTDISPLFLANAERDLGAFPFVRFQLLDVEADPREQGFAAGSFDLVLAANVVHATRDLRGSLENIRLLLKRGGLLVLLEGTRRQRWVDLMFGLTEGWWRFRDTGLRSDHPLIGPRAWLQLGQDCGFASTAVLPHPSAPNPTGQTVLLAQQGSAQTAGVPVSEGKTPERWLILRDEGGVGAELARLAESFGVPCQTVSVAEWQGGRLSSLEHPEPSAASVGEVPGGANANLGEFSDVIYLSPLDVAFRDTDDPVMLGDAVERSCGLALEVVQWLATAEGRKARLWIVTRGAQAAGFPVDAGSIPLATLWGFGRTVAMEHPDIWGGLIDLSTESSAADARQLFAELRSATADNQVAFTTGGRHVARLRSTEITGAAASPVGFESNGVYLITGATGGMGSAVLQWMVDCGARRLVAVARHAPQGETEELFRSLRRQGVDLRLSLADVADAQSVRKVMQDVESIGAPLRGVFHIAGVFDDRVAVRLDWERFRRVLAPKVHGGWNLHLATRHLPLEFFVMFSSAASFLGPVGLGNYAAANAALDAIAHYRRSIGLPGLSINWGAWGGVGMAQAVGEGRERQWIRGGFGTMTAGEGLETLGRLLTSAAAQVAVLPVSWSSYVRDLDHRAIGGFFDRVIMADDPRHKPQKHGHLDPAVRSPAGVVVGDDLDPERYVRELVAAELGLPIARLNVQRPLTDLGFDSLMAVQLRNKLQGTLSVSIPVSQLIKGPSVVELAAMVAMQLGSPDAGGAVSVAADGADRSANLEDLSDEQIDRLLGELLEEGPST